MKRTGFKKKANKPMKRGRLRLAGKSTTSELKRDIQALLRQIAINRDGDCVLRGVGTCSGPLQAEHLVTRSNSATFADMRNIVCLCQYHHIFWKPQHSRLYWEYIEKILGSDRWNWVKRAEADQRAYKMDWKLVKIALEHDLKALTNHT